jgi:hypothetical protein
MALERKAHVVLCNVAQQPADSLSALNAMLAEGWQIASVSPTGGAGGGQAGFGHIWFASLVILEREVTGGS